MPSGIKLGMPIDDIEASTIWKIADHRLSVRPVYRIYTSTSKSQRGQDLTSVRVYDLNNDGRVDYISFGIDQSQTNLITIVSRLGGGSERISDPIRPCGYKRRTVYSETLPIATDRQIGSMQHCLLPPDCFMPDMPPCENSIKGQHVVIDHSSNGAWVRVFSPDYINYGKQVLPRERCNRDFFTMPWEVL
jgi:hypothetical protein